MLLGCIADDFTGASDIGNTLAKGGMRVAQYNGIPDSPASRHLEAGVVALKSRTAPVQEAIEKSVKAATWLLDQGCEQLYFKYCSTFDSTKEGNIGPVAEALSELTGEDKVLFCPAFPAAGRSVFQGTLFVDDVPLNESGMKDHPLTPMTDSDLRRWLGFQTQMPVYHLSYQIVCKGYHEIATFLEDQKKGFFIADAIDDENLLALGKAASQSKLLTGGSGMAMGLPDNFRVRKKIGSAGAPWKRQKGRAVILSGSCSVTTRKQVAEFRKQCPALELTAADILGETYTVERVKNWVNRQRKTPLVYTSADPQVVCAAQLEFGREFLASEIERFFGRLAAVLVDCGFTRIISAGGETSGAIVEALKVGAMELGPEIAPGVPALKVIDRELVLALKSGNFGGSRFFEDALEIL